jgi:hypothetical protein
MAGDRLHVGIDDYCSKQGALRASSQGKTRPKIVAPTMTGRCQTLTDPNGQRGQVVSTDVGMGLQNAISLTKSMVLCSLPLRHEKRGSTRGYNT